MPTSPPNESTATTRRTRLRRDLLVLAGLFLLILLFLWPALLPGRVLLPLDIVTESWPPWQQPNQPAIVHNPLISDVVDYIYPVKQFAANAVRAGVLPLWNPYVLGGYPFTYNSQAGLFYPLSLLYYLLPGPAAVDATIFLQVGLGALFMVLYLRALGLRRLAVLAGAIIFSFNGLLVVWLEWQVVHAAVIWLPLQLYLVERWRTTVNKERAAPGSPPTLRARLRYPALLALAFAPPWLGGHWNWALYGSMTFLAYLLWRLGPLLFRPGTTRRSGLNRRLAALLLAALLLGVALSLIQVLPAFNYLRQGHRQALPFAASLEQGLFNRLVALLIPNFFGNPVHHNWWGPVNYNETTFYVGLLPLFLATLTPFLRRDAISLFFLGWGGLGFLWALGTPLYGLLYILPVFSGLLPSRAAILVVFAVAVLAALSLDRLQGRVTASRLTTMTGLVTIFGLLLVAGYALYYREDVTRTWTYLRPYAFIFLFFWLAAALLLFARLRGRLRVPAFTALSLALLVADLFLAGYGYNTIATTDRLYPPTATGDFLLADPEPLRIATLPQGVAYPPNASLAVPLENMSGYEPAIQQRVVDFVSAAEGEEAIYFERELLPLHAVDSPLFDLLNVKYVVTTTDWHADTPTRDVAQEQVDRWLPLAPGASLGQTFHIADAGLQRIDLHLRPATTTGADGVVTVRVFTADGGQELAHATLPAGELTAPGWYSFYVSPFPSEWGRDFRLTVTGEDVSLEVAAAAADVYPGGSILAAGAPAAGDLAFVTFYLPRPRLAHEDGKTRVYLNEGYLPRAFAVPQALVATDRHEALAAVTAHASELDRLVILEAEGQPLPDLPLAASPPPAAPPQVAVTAYDLNRVQVRVDGDAPSFLVLGDTYYPGWRADVDGQPAPVYRADTILRAVAIPAGEHTVTFTFRPPDFLFGAAVSGLALLACFLILLPAFRARPRHDPVGDGRQQTVAP